MSSPQHEFMQLSEKQKLATVYNNKQLYKVWGESKLCSNLWTFKFKTSDFDSISYWIIFRFGPSFAKFVWIKS